MISMYGFNTKKVPNKLTDSEASNIGNWVNKVEKNHAFITLKYNKANQSPNLNVGYQKSNL